MPEYGESVILGVLKVSLLTVPVEPNYLALQPKASAGRDVFTSIRSEGRLPMMPKIAIVSLLNWMGKSGWPRESWDYYDVDMELPDDERLARYFREARPDVVGLSAVVSTCYYQVRRISRILRQTLPDAWIVLGGSLTASANLVLRKTAVDICVVGDGEIAWVQLLERLRGRPRSRGLDRAALETVTGLAFLDEAGELRNTGYGPAIPADDMPFPDYDLLQSGLKDRPEDLRHYFRIGLGVHEFQTDPRAYEPGRRPNVVNLWTSKGCVARCTFCQRSTKGYRTPSLDAFERHLLELKERFDVGFIHILDENFGSNHEFSYECARLMDRHGFLWMASGVRVSSVEREDVEFYKAHGCASLKFGVETGSQKIMNVMEKKFTVERVHRTLKHLADFDMNSPLAVMVGMPGETNETALATGRFLGEVSHMQGFDPELQRFSIFYALPLPGTPLYVYGQQLGLIGKSPDEEEAYLLSVSGTGASKANYVNLNGAPLWDVILWDWLVKMEATRIFHQLDAASPIDRSRFAYRAARREDNLERRKEAVGRSLTISQVLHRMQNGVPTGIKAKLFYVVDNLLEDHVAYSRRVQSLPRWLVYPAVQALLHATFLLQTVVVRLLGRGLNLYQPRRPAPPLDLEASPSEVRVGMSLRSLVKARQLQRGPAPTATERVQDMLAIGL